MPRYVDHEARRRFMAETAARVVGEHGLDALTFRNVARAAGSSTTVLTHYFADKHDLMLSTYEFVAARQAERLELVKQRRGSLYDFLLALLPIDDIRRTEWRLLTCYWGLAISDPRLAEAQARHVRSAQRRIEAMVREARPDAKASEVELIARRLGTLVQGLGSHHALDPDYWPPSKLRRVLAHEIASVDLGTGAQQAGAAS